MGDFDISASILVPKNSYTLPLPKKNKLCTFREQGEKYHAFTCPKKKKSPMLWRDRANKFVVVPDHSPTLSPPPASRVKWSSLNSSNFLPFTDIIHSGESLFVKKDVKMPVQGLLSYVLLILRCYQNRQSKVGILKSCVHTFPVSQAVQPVLLSDFILFLKVMSVLNVLYVRLHIVGICKRCGYISSQPLCKACVLLEGLNKGLPRYFFAVV